MNDFLNSKLVFSKFIYTRYNIFSLSFVCPSGQLLNLLLSNIFAWDYVYLRKPVARIALFANLKIFISLPPLPCLPYILILASLFLFVANHLVSFSLEKPPIQFSHSNAFQRIVKRSKYKKIFSFISYDCLSTYLPSTISSHIFMDLH